MKINVLLCCLLCLPVNPMWAALTWTGADDAGRHADTPAIIRRQFVEFCVQQSVDASDVRQHVETMDEDGTWPDIDYTSQRRGEWPTRVHLDRLKEMATAHEDPASAFHQHRAMKHAVLNGLDHWIKNDYRNPNWYNERIGVPYRVGSVLVLLEDAVPEKMLAAARPILDRSELGMTGQNKVWCAGIGIMKGVLYADQDLLARAVEDIWSELRVSTGEGIQPDWSFHQHGPQQQFGNYGVSFGDDMVQWASVLRGTDYALAGEALETLRTYLLEGPSWILWNGRMDFSGCGRHVDQGCQQEKAWSILRQLDDMKTIDCSFAAAYGSTGRRVGFNPFWRSDMGVQRRPDWYASVKMSSTHVIGAESCNSENMLGLHMGHGVLLSYVDGDEYEDLVPLWDWKRLPGTTCDQGFDALTPPTLDGYGGSDFAGVLGAGETGVAAMVFQHNGLTAHKAWFFLKDQIICLGAGIRGETEGPVYTSVQQSWLRGKVQSGKGWIHHDGIGYQMFDGEFKLKTGTVEGNWNTSFPTRGDRPATGDVFNVWIDHGESPAAGTYSYRVIPKASAEEMRLNPSIVIENSKAVQAVACGGDAWAVFYEAGTLQLGEWWRVRTDGPCLLHVADGQLTVTDPTHRQERLNVTLNSKAYILDLPQGAGRGSQVSRTTD